jgi:predicted translin family RNA/ssDNA-binding protein
MKKHFQAMATQQFNDLDQLLQEKEEAVVTTRAWYTQLKQAVSHLIDKDFNALVQLLYRVDVSEEKLQRLLRDFPAADAAGIIANLLLERQLQKIKSRREHMQRDQNIPEEERW